MARKPMSDETKKKISDALKAHHKRVTSARSARIRLRNRKRQNAKKSRYAVLTRGPLAPKRKKKK